METFNFHKMAIRELCERFNTTIESGLTDTQATEGNAKHGLNTLTPPPTTPEWVKFCKCLFSKSALMLWFGAILCFVAYGYGVGVRNYYLGIVISGLITVDSFYSYYLKMKSDNIMEGLKKRAPQYTHCRRNGEMVILKASDLTLGDIVKIKKGDMVPADIRIIESNGCKVDNVNLTGESEPQLRSPKFTDENPLETQNIAFLSTSVVEGSAVGMVVHIGDRTVYGRIADLGNVLYSGQTPINKEIEHFIFFFSAIAVFLGILLSIIAYVFGFNWLYVIIFLIGLVPMGLHAKINDNIAQAFKWMASKDCLVKNMEAMETLGSITCICSNKTGILTQNRMTVAHMWFDNKIVEADTSEDQSGGAILKNADSWKPLERAALLCNSAEFKEGQDNCFVLRREVDGNGIDAAILKCTELTVGNVTDYRARNKKVYEIPFNSTGRYQISIHEIEEPAGKRHLVVMKGAPEKILERCNTILMEGTERPLTQEWKTATESAIKELAGLGERVIGFCDMMLPDGKYPIGYTFDPEEEDFDQGFRFVGLMAMIDPPRAAAPETIRKLRQHFGVKVIMVTGDNPITAKAIARSIGLIQDGQETIEDIAERLNISVDEVNPRDARGIVVHGEDLKDLSDVQLDEILRNHTDIVFARASPFQKLVIVEACQRNGEIVAVTGQSLNDTPALKTADIGIAMGSTASDAAKNAADVILLDNNFANILAGIEAGKEIVKSLRKFSFFTHDVRSAQE